MGRTYVTDLKHFLTDNQDVVPTMPAPARKMASFLVLIVDAVTTAVPHTTSGIDTGVRCRRRNCHGRIIGALEGPAEPVHWYCLNCGDRGTISNWQRTKWDNSEG
jgi:hypothetical protein